MLKMLYRELGRTGWKVSEISFGAWAIGADWGSVDDQEALAALHQAVDRGCNFIDTADVYGDGHSERLIAQLKRERPGEEIIVATKCGRRLPRQVAEGYNPKTFNEWVDRSLHNLETDCLDLVQLHCPPTQVYYMPEVFESLDELVRAGKIRYYGVSVEKVEEALKAIEYPGVQTVQIVFNMFRHRPSELFFQEAKRRKVGILARVPLASGLLTGRMSSESVFSADDHRHFNRFGQSFDRGETFSGVDFEMGLHAVEHFKALIGDGGMTMTQFALRWILMFDAVTCAIPGAKRPEQVEENFSVSELPPLSEAQMFKIREIYGRYIRTQVHHRW